MKNTKITSENHDLGILILRIGLGGLMLFHGVAKFTDGIQFIIEALCIKGLPLWIAYGVYIGEILVPLLVLLGIYTRRSALVYAINMFFSIWLVYSEKLFSLTPHGGWIIELNMLFLLGALTLVFTGGGKYCLKGYCRKVINPSKI